MSELHAAVQNDLALARTLLGDGDGERCDYGGVNIEDVGGSTPMHWAAASNSVGGVRLLAASGGELEWINQDGHSPLSIAAQEGHTESLRALMDAGALAESTDGFGEISPLLIAAFNNRPECVRALLEVRCRTRYSHAPLHHSHASPLPCLCRRAHRQRSTMLSATHQWRSPASKATRASFSSSRPSARTAPFASSSPLACSTRPSPQAVSAEAHSSAHPSALSTQHGLLLSSLSDADADADTPVLLLPLSSHPIPTLRSPLALDPAPTSPLSSAQAQP